MTDEDLDRVERTASALSLANPGESMRLVREVRRLRRVISGLGIDPDLCGLPCPFGDGRCVLPGNHFGPHSLEE